MKPTNLKERKRSIWIFVLIFSMLLGMITLCGYLTLQTGRAGVLALEQKHAAYTSIFEKQVSYVYKIEDIIKRLNHILEKDRTLSQHKQYQMIISNLRDELQNDMALLDASDKEHFEIYTAFENQISVIQDVLDKYEAEQEIYYSKKELLERCKEKYEENLQRIKDLNYEATESE
ncbi:MAG: hypothetical protein OIF50_07085 [Flavobacteriaceae bacterium]|nr:hypothetical protein [Flavobacteriaceae bacterium]